MKSKFLSSFLVLFSTVCFGATASVQAQSILLEPNNVTAIQLEMLRPNAHYTDISNSSFTFFLSGRVRVGRDHLLRAEVPFVNYKEEGGVEYWRTPEDDSQFGNPYLGLDVGSPESGFQGEFGVRAPVVSELTETAAAGSGSDYIERIEAFLPDLVPIYMGLNYRVKTENGFGMRFRMVPVFWIWVGERSEVDNDIYVLYSGQAWYQDKKVGVGGGITGRIITTGDASGFDERSFHQFDFFANYTFGTWMPGFQIRFPLDDSIRARGINPTYSLSLGWKL